MPIDLHERKRILLVDDEPFNVINLQLSIGRLGVKGLAGLVDRAYNGLEAVSKIRDSFERGTHIYGLIITDLSMPVMDGYQEAQEIRQFHRANEIP